MQVLVSKQNPYLLVNMMNVVVSARIVTLHEAEAQPIIRMIRQLQNGKPCSAIIHCCTEYSQGGCVTNAVASRLPLGSYGTMLGMPRGD